MVFRVATEAFQTSEQVEVWRDTMNRAVVPMEGVPRAREAFVGPLRASMAVSEVAEARIATVAAGPHTVRRSPRLIRGRDEEVYSLFVPLAGVCRIGQGERRQTLTVGEVMVLDSSDCYELAFTGDHRDVCVTFPRRLVALSRAEISPLTAVALDATQGSAALLRSFVPPLARQAHGGGVTGHAAFRLARSTVDLAETMLLERLGDPRHSAGRQRTLVLGIQRDVESRLGAPDLSPSQLADRHHISVRYLHRLFEGEGETVAEWIRRRRLERCRRDLSDPALRTLPVASIGARWGLRDAAHFSRAFKAAYGISPRAFRVERPAPRLGG